MTFFPRSSQGVPPRPVRMHRGTFSEARDLADKARRAGFEDAAPVEKESVGWVVELQSPFHEWRVHLQTVECLRSLLMEVREPDRPSRPDQARRGCDVEGCERAHWGRGMCQRHYDRWGRKGAA